MISTGLQVMGSMLRTFSLELWINRVRLPILLVRGQLNSENEPFLVPVRA